MLNYYQQEGETMKKSWILVILLIGLGIFGGYQYHQANRIFFYFNDEVAESAVGEIEIQEGLDLSADAIGLRAEKGGQDITNQIIAPDVIIDELKQYSLIYKVEDTEFRYELNVYDHTAPIITFKSDYVLKQNEPFDIQQLDIKAIDNYDGDISDQVVVNGSVDVSMPADYELQLEVSDRCGNKAEAYVIVRIEALIVSDPNDNEVNIVSDPNSITVMINKQNMLPDGWEPMDLVSIGNNHYLRAEAADALQQMQNSAQNSDIVFNVISSYRTQEYQRNLYNRYMASDPYNAPYYSAYPRTSEHELGLAVDISYDYSLHNDLDQSALGQWMAEHAHEYGWIMRYPANKTDSTGYYFEAWHWRYVGIELAKALHSSNLSMEEYY